MGWRLGGAPSGPRLRHVYVYAQNVYRKFRLHEGLHSGRTGCSPHSLVCGEQLDRPPTRLLFDLWSESVHTDHNSGYVLGRLLRREIACRDHAQENLCIALLQPSKVVWTAVKRQEPAVFSELG